MAGHAVPAFHLPKSRSPRREAGANGRIAERSKNCYVPVMESKFGLNCRGVVVLQDHKRLPARFFSCLSGALNSLRG